MSEKITFKELIESIAEETDKSKQSTQDFVKNFVEVINDGLEEDGKVNIAGFGKFNLKHVDERDGYNPQREEKITIPAHNKIIFKPYKDVRERVNAPYAHLEPKLLQEESEEDQNTTEEGSTDQTSSEQRDFIPTGPPTSEAEDKKVSEDTTQPSQEEEDEDIVEFKPETDEETNKKLNDSFEGSDQSNDEKTNAENEKSVEDEGDQQEEHKDENELIEETIFQTEELINDSEDLLDSLNEDEEEEEDKTTTSDFEPNNKRAKKNSSSLPLTIAAVVILLLTAGGVWFFSTTSEENQPEMIAQETLSPSDNVSAAADDQLQAGDEQSNDEQQPSQDQQQSQDQIQTQKQSSSSSTASVESSATVSSESKSEGVEIEQGQTLWSLAEEKYGNPRLWPWIYGNNDSMENPDFIYAGSSISVPLPSGPNNNLNSADSVGVAKGFIATYHWYKDQNSSKAKDHLWGAKVYHDDIRSIADVDIDKADLKYANRAR